MNISDLAEDYLVDPREGMRKLTAGLLNEVMQLEAEDQIQARRYERTDKRRAHRNGTRQRSLKTIHGKSNLINPKSENFHLRPTYSKDILA
jgi:putative transposase